MKRKPNQFALDLIGLFGLAVFVMSISGCGKPKPLAADTIFSEKGTYTAPDERVAVEVKTAGNGQMRYRFVFSGASTEYNTFPADKEWFMCWDSRDRLWVHVADNSTCYWYPPEIGTLMIQHKMTPPQPSDLGLMPNTFRDKLPEKMKRNAPPMQRQRRAQ